MANTQSILDVLENGDSSTRVSLLKPAMQKAVEKGLLSKAAPTEIYEKNWEAVESVIIAFLTNAEKELG
jgi:hypothetical protein